MYIDFIKTQHNKYFSFINSIKNKLKNNLIVDYKLYKYKLII